MNDQARGTLPCGSNPIIAHDETARQRQDRVSALESFCRSRSGNFWCASPN